MQGYPSRVQVGRGSGNSDIWAWAYERIPPVNTSGAVLRTNQLTDGQTEIAGYRVTCTRLKIQFVKKNNTNLLNKAGYTGQVGASSFIIS